MAGRQGFEPRYADPESGNKYPSCWFVMYFPAPCLTVLHGFRRLTLPYCCQVSTLGQCIGSGTATAAQEAWFPVPTASNQSCEFPSARLALVCTNSYDPFPT